MLVSKYYYAMRKSYLLFIPLLIWGCEQTYDNVIDTSTENYQVTSIVGIKDTINLYNSPGDSLLNVKIIFTPESEVNKVQFSVFASDNSQLDPSPVEMIQDSLNQFANHFILSNRNPNGVYTIKFSAVGSNGINKQVAVSNFNFVNGQDSIPPVISNLVLPDTIERNVSFIFSVTAYDENGLNDIESVNFVLYRPDNTVVEESPGDTLFTMHDDGNLVVFGDTTANDGIYSFKNSFGQTSQTGNWKFVFQAIDRSDKLSNIIERLLFVQ